MPAGFAGDPLRSAAHFSRALFLLIFNSLARALHR
jgi:hypothetical protein